MTDSRPEKGQAVGVRYPASSRTRGYGVVVAAEPDGRFVVQLLSTYLGETEAITVDQDDLFRPAGRNRRKALEAYEAWQARAEARYREVRSLADRFISGCAAGE